jgi:hypothetical protein
MKAHWGWAPVAHTFNPCYSGGRDQEVMIQSQPQENSSTSWDPILKNHNKKDWWSDSSGKSSFLEAWDPEIKPQCCQKKDSYVLDIY